ncbi:MAG: site-2 protease family protein [Firmicutes bacterium]|nr:site-2 protease family protein [Bacillota bacterium]
MYIIIAIIIFGILIAIHEFGHFTAAKLCGVKVEEFAIGMGPALFKKQKGETVYALRILPIGGFCAMAGEDEESDDPRAFTNQGFWKKFVILCAGSFMNLVLGIVLILIMYAGAQAFVTPTIDHFMDGCPYEGAEAMQAGDTFYSIDGQRIYLVSDVSSFLMRGDGVYDIVMLRDGEKIELKDFALTTKTYAEYANEGPKYGFVFGYTEATFGTKLEYTWNTTLEFSRLVWLGLGDLINGKVGLKDMSGPVGIVDMMNEVGQQAESAKAAADNLLYISAFIAVNLAIMNMLPIPALDGGRVFLMIVTVIIEAVSRKKLDPKYEGYIHLGGMVLLLGLMALVMYNDIAKLITG